MFMLFRPFLVLLLLHSILCVDTGLCTVTIDDKIFSLNFIVKTNCNHLFIQIMKLQKMNSKFYGISVTLLLVWMGTIVLILSVWYSMNKMELVRVILVIQPHHFIIPVFIQEIMIKQELYLA